MRILALEPYYGGSHRAFVDGWASRSRHDWTVLTLPAHHWKWRMRGAAVTMARQVSERVAAGESWDVVFCSDMLNLAEWVALAPPEAARLPRVAYFHESQLTYPTRREDPRDVHFALTNMTTALAADAVWWNSAFHREAFLAALDELLQAMPDDRPTGVTRSIRGRSDVQPPPVRGRPPRGSRAPGPLRVLWAARWEHDKGPEAFFDAMRLLAADHVDFRLSVIGPRFRDAPYAFERGRRDLAGRIDRWGYQASAEAYAAALAEADVFASTARHEFFGIAAVEAVAAGAFPLLPERLAYPEVFAELAEGEPIFHDGSPEHLATRLAESAALVETGGPWRSDPDAGRRAVARYTWAERLGTMDTAVESVAG